MSDLSEKFVSEAAKWVRIPYLHRGMTRNGVDCTGLIIAILSELGYMTDYMLRQYPPDWNLHGGAGNYIEDEIVKIADEIPKHQTEPGDLILIRFGRCLSHCAIVMPADLILHAFLTAKMVKYDLLRGPKWGNRWMKTYRLSLMKLRSI